MNLPAKTQYACVAMLELAKQAGSGTPLQAKVIAQQHDIPSRFLVQILLQLKGAGLVTSTRGAAGGYRLACDPRALTLADLREVIEGSAEEVEVPANASWASQAVRTAWCEASQCEQQALAAVTLADLLAKAPAEDGMYFI